MWRCGRVNKLNSICCQQQQIQYNMAPDSRLWPPLLACYHLEGNVFINKASKQGSLLVSTFPKRLYFPFSSTLSSSCYKVPHSLLPPLQFFVQVMDDYKRSNIPAFGDWDYADGLPITQYFESARQAGLIRYSCGDRDLYTAANVVSQTDLYHKPTIAVVPRRKTKGAEKGYPQYPCVVKEQRGRKEGSVCDVMEPQLYPSSSPSPDPPRRTAAPKPVDEDLYGIPPEFLCATTPKRKKRHGFFSRCLQPSCDV